jgi:murein DD-endopeptidase MepM/ murein hydrolase activator NlpD
MRGIVVPKNAIPLSTLEKNKALSTPAKKQTAQKFHTALADATRLHQDKTIQAPQDCPPPQKTYTIQQGDTLSEIVAKESKKLGQKYPRHDLYNMVKQVADLNHLANPNNILPGQKLDLTSITQSQPASKSASSFVPESIVTTTKTPDLPIPSKIQAPVSGKITSLFGMRNHPVMGETLHHDGIDISQPTGTPVKPLTSGVVTFAGNEGGYGLMVEIDHGNGLTSRYAHLSKLLVHKGEQINPSQPLGQVGQTGLTTGPHLHLEIHRQNTAIDPLTVLNRQQIETDILIAEAHIPHRL